MGRVQLFEWMDQPWLPALLRDGITDHLKDTEELFDPFKAVGALLSEAVAHSGQGHFVDLCSGGGGPALQLVRQLQPRGVVEGVVLTDRFPNLGAFRAAASQPGVRFHHEPVDATAVPEELLGTRTVFNALHHFPPTAARAVLADATRQQQPILIVEALSRSLPGLATALGVASLGPLLAALRRPLQPGILLLSTLLPLLPLILAWEGAVSAMRCYSTDELHALTGGLGGDSYRWQIDRHRTHIPFLSLTSLVGIPC
ncbi:MAG: hypothetical protein ACI8S6_001046 [Myxococcota bacterium]|jgi:hypothetical protein